jgi:hypothetical protein
MGVAKLTDEFRKTDENGVLDFQETLEYLKNIMELMNENKKN